MVPGFKAKEIKPTKTVGQRLKQARLKKELSLEQAERLTKVKLKYLRALEEDRYDLLPTEVYSLGFLRCYGEVLGLNTRKLLDHYRAERQAVDSAKSQATVSLAPRRQLADRRLLLTPKTILTGGSVILVLGLILYIVSGVRSFLAPPGLRLTEPPPESRVASNMVTLRGETDPAVSLIINGELVTVDPAGVFNREVALLPGLNTLELVATNRIGKETRVVRKVLAEYQTEVLESPVPTSPTPSPSSSVSPTPSPTTDPTQSPKE